jgi:ABC-type iron transport system FetAB ATPase subunit
LNRPSTVLLFDEPTAACDSLSCAAVERALISSGVACILITHDERQAIRVAHKRIILSPVICIAEEAV